MYSPTLIKYYEIYSNQLTVVRAVENLTKFKYVETTVTNRNYIQNGIQEGLDKVETETEKKKKSLTEK